MLQNRPKVGSRLVTVNDLFLSFTPGDLTSHFVKNNSSSGSYSKTVATSRNRLHSTTLLAVARMEARKSSASAKTLAAHTPNSFINFLKGRSGSSISAAIRLHNRSSSFVRHS